MTYILVTTFEDEIVHTGIFAGGLILFEHGNYVHVLMREVDFIYLWVCDCMLKYKKMSIFLSLQKVRLFEESALKNSGRVFIGVGCL